MVGHCKSTPSPPLRCGSPAARGTFVGRGYGTRTRPGDDGRVRVVELTGRGRAARRAAVEIADRIEAELVERLGRDALDA